MPRWIVTIMDEEDANLWDEWVAGGGVWDERNFTPPGEACEVCSQVVPHRTRAFVSKVDGRLTHLLCEEMAVN